MSTTDSGVAIAAGIRPPSPCTVKRTGRSTDCKPSSARRSNGRTISMNVTSSPGSRDSASCTSAIVRIRRTESPTAAIASGCVSRRACSRSSDEIVCRLFFDPVVDLADRGVLAQQQPVALAELADVAHQQHRAGHVLVAVGHSTNGTHRHSSVTAVALLELLDHRHLALERLAHRTVVEAELGEPHPDRATPGCRRGAAPSWRWARRTAPRRRRRATSRRRRLAVRRSSRRRAAGTGTCRRDHARRSSGTSRRRRARARPAGGRPARSTRGSARRSARPRYTTGIATHAGLVGERPRRRSRPRTVLPSR